MLKQLVLLSVLFLFSWESYAQQFEILEIQEAYQATFNQQLRIPIRIKNNGEKAQFFVIRKVKGELGDTQKGYFCLSNNCLDATISEFSKKVEPGETLQELYFVIESGIQAMQTTLRFEIFQKGSAHDIVDRSVAISVDEKPGRSFIFQSKDISIQDVYPNPVQTQASIDYKLHSESVKARLTLHNILGKIMGDYELPSSETRVKIQADELTSGVYFYTVYIDNSGVLTRKLIVRK
jgi:hypothetical protein